MTDHSKHHGPGVHATPNAGKRSQFEADMDKGMARMMQDMHGPGYTGNPDRDFLAMRAPV